MPSLPDEDFFPIDQLAKQWNVEVERILHFAVMRKIRVSINTHLLISTIVDPFAHGTGKQRILVGPCQLDVFDVQDILSSGAAIVKKLTHNGDEVELENPKSLTVRDLGVTSQEKSEFETRYDPLEKMGTDDPTQQTDTSDEKPLTTRERNTVARIIAALAQAAGLDLSEPWKAAKAIEAATSLNGYRVSDDTIVKWLTVATEEIPPEKRKS